MTDSLIRLRAHKKDSIATIHTKNAVLAARVCNNTPSAPPATIANDNPEISKIAEERMRVAASLQSLRQSLAEHEARVAKARHRKTLDLAIVLDLTGSMGPYIFQAKEKIIDFVRQFSADLPHLHLRIALVGYRDFGDEEPLVFVPFTEDSASVCETIKACKPVKGCDEAEDVTGALEAALKLEWRGKMRALVHLADMPCHGGDFHDLGKDGDRFRDGDPLGRDPRELCKHLHDANVSYTFGELTPNTRKMCAEFAKAYAASDVDTRAFFKVLQITDPSSAFIDVVNASITMTMATCEMRGI